MKLGGLVMSWDVGTGGRDMGRAHLKLKMPKAPLPSTTSGCRIVTSVVIRRGGGSVSNGRGGLARELATTAASSAAHSLVKARHVPPSRMELMDNRNFGGRMGKSYGSIREQGRLKGIRGASYQSGGSLSMKIKPQIAERALQNVNIGLNF